MNKKTSINDLSEFVKFISKRKEQKKVVTRDPNKHEPNKKNFEDKKSVRVNLWVTEEMSDNLRVLSYITGISNFNNLITYLLEQFFEKMSEDPGFKTGFDQLGAIKKEVYESLTDTEKYLFDKGRGSLRIIDHGKGD